MMSASTQPDALADEKNAVKCICQQNADALVNCFKFGTPAFPKSGTVFSEQGVMKFIGIDILSLILITIAKKCL